MNLDELAERLEMKNHEEDRLALGAFQDLIIEVTNLDALQPDPSFDDFI